MKFRRVLLEWFLLPAIGLTLAVWAWSLASAATAHPRTKVPVVPSPVQTWENSKTYLWVADPADPADTGYSPAAMWRRLFAKRGELDQGMGAFTLLSMALVFKGYFLALAVGTPLGFLLGKSRFFARMFDPLIQVLRPVSPLAWLPLGYLIFRAVQLKFPASKVDVPEMAAIFTIAICAMWPTVLNTAVGVRAIPQDYLNVARVLRLSRTATLFKILIPATLPYMFTGFRLSLGIAWLVIVAAEMLTGRPGVGGFLWQEYNAGSSEHIILSILVIGTVGFVLDRLMSVLEANIQYLLNLPGVFRRLLERLGVRHRPAPAPAAVPA
jgi:nitrate/nitrite transport system permease protein